MISVRKFWTIVILVIALSFSFLASANTYLVKGDKVKDFWHGLVPYLCVSGFFAALILAEHNMSIASIIMIVTFNIIDSVK